MASRATSQAGPPDLGDAEIPFLTKTAACAGDADSSRITPPRLGAPPHLGAPPRSSAEIARKRLEIEVQCLFAAMDLADPAAPSARLPRIAGM